MKYFLTGATGFLGGYLAEKLLQEGHQVAANYRSKQSLEGLPSWQKLVEWQAVDLLDTLSLEEAMSGCDAVIHAAGMVSFRKSDFNELLRVNGEGTANVVNTCLYLNRKPLCYISSVAAVGKGGHNRAPIDESAKWQTENEASAYAISKQRGEQEVWRGIEEGLPAVIVNPSVILGIGDWERSSLQLLKQAANPPFRYPPGNLNYVDVRDVATAVYQLMQQGSYGERFILNAAAIPYKTFFEEVAYRMGKKPPTQPLKKWEAQVVVHTAKLAALFSAEAAKLNADSLKNAFHKHQYNGNKITEQTGLNYRSLDATLDWCCEGLLQSV